MNNREQLIEILRSASEFYLKDDSVGITVLFEKQADAILEQFRSPDMAGIGQIYSAIESRIRHFESIYHKFEANELRPALDTVRRLVPPSTFESSPPDMAEAFRADIKRLDELRRLHIEPYNLGEMGEISRIISRLANKLASLCSPGSGWVKVDYTKPETLPEFGVDVIVYAPEEKDPVIIDHCFKGADGNVYWDWCNNPDTYKPTVTHWQPLPAPPGE